MSQNFKNELFEYSKAENGVGRIVINQVNEPANLFSFDFVKAFCCCGVTGNCRPRK